MAGKVRRPRRKRAQGLRQLEDENHPLKKPVADLSPDAGTLKAVISKMYWLEDLREERLAAKNHEASQQPVCGPMELQRRLSLLQREAAG